eukprot:627716-Amphidinium_carterae.2
MAQTNHGVRKALQALQALHLEAACMFTSQFGHPRTSRAQLRVQRHSHRQAGQGAVGIACLYTLCF